MPLNVIIPSSHIRQFQMTRSCTRAEIIDFRKHTRLTNKAGWFIFRFLNRKPKWCFAILFKRLFLGACSGCIS